MPDARETTFMDVNSPPVNFAPIPILTYQLPRNLCIFSGDGQQDASRWLEDFEIIATYNRCDEQLYKVRRGAERELFTRAHLLGETSELCTQDKLSFSQKANSSMSENEKVAHFMKGIVEDLYQTLLVQDIETVDEFIKSALTSKVFEEGVSHEQDSRGYLIFRQYQSKPTLRT
ncbi:CCHC-type domain-containing protein [Trichonephila clavipes]|nr:CCHC-type domain-containing protein [Trichonephila clavipes]